VTDEKKMYTSAYPIPGLTADIVVLVPFGGSYKVLLIERGDEPYKGCWALPGGFSMPNESLAQTAIRELKEETTIEITDGVIDKFEYVNQFSTPGRDPRGWTVSHLFVYNVGSHYLPNVKAMDDAVNYQWVAVDAIIKGTVLVAFDHRDMILQALEKVKK